LGGNSVQSMKRTAPVMKVCHPDAIVTNVQSLLGLTKDELCTEGGKWWLVADAFKKPECFRIT
jgi:hypothetical protein